MRRGSGFREQSLQKKSKGKEEHKSPEELQIELAHVNQTAVETAQVRVHPAIPPRVDPGLGISAPSSSATAMEENQAANAGVPR